MKENSFDNLLKWRSIGPFRGGRVITAVGDPVDPATFYFGAVAGGIWKSTDAGMYWENISDGFLTTSPVGALAIAPSDRNVIYAGTGESTIRIDVSTGNGVYKSTDAGLTWKHIGLDETRTISKIRVHPQDPDLVYVAALGHPFGPNPERGVYRSKDGGETWELVLHQSEQAGAIDLSLDPNNPRILYASIWQAYRNFWNIASGGPESRLYKSTDGGDTWVDISQNDGLPKGPLGKMAVAVSPAMPSRVWALIEAKEHGIYRSDDSGQTWQRLNKERKLIDRAWYFTHITADPCDADTLYVNNLGFYKSTDGGSSYTTIDTPHGDNHDLWIDPNNPQRMIQANDGGANVSFNGGASWSTIFNQPTGQFYRIETDNRYPYRVYGTQQDNSSVAVPSRSDLDVIPWAECKIAGTGESGYIAPHPDDPEVGFVGAIGSSPGAGNALQRYDFRTGQIRLVSIWPDSAEGLGAKAEKYRFAWTYPILFSPHDSKVLYAAGNQVFRTDNEGQSWEVISPDLTRAEPETLEPSGGAINKDAIGAEHYATVFSFIESPHIQGLLWAGSDDGLVHVSKDNGENWSNVTPPAMEKFSQVHCIEPSPFDPATVYVAATRYKLDDYRPFLFKTSDYGATWETITGGIPADDFTRVVRADPARQGLLYAGTETGLYISFDDGASWTRFQLNLPITPIYDLKIKENDLIAGTHGRGFWILDDLTPLHQFEVDQMEKATHLFTPRTTIRPKPYWFEGWVGGKPGKNYAVGFGAVTPYYEKKTPEGAVEKRFLDAGENPSDGAVITYHLKAGVPTDQKLSLRISTAGGDEIKTFTSKPAPNGNGKSAADDEKASLFLPANPGMNRFEWNLRWADGIKVKGKEPMATTPRGPRVPPGTYQLELTLGDHVETTTFEIVKDPRIDASDADLKAQFDLLMQVRDKISEANAGINKIRSLKTQVTQWQTLLKEHADAAAFKEKGDCIVEKLDEIEGLLIPTGATTEWEGFNYGARRISRLNGLVPIVASADYRPTDQSIEVYNLHAAELDGILNQLDSLIKTDVAEFNQLMSEKQVVALVTD